MSLKEGDENLRLFPVMATVAKQNFWDNFEGRRTKRCLSTVRKSGADYALGLIPMGYLLEEVVREHFPKSYEYLSVRNI